MSVQGDDRDADLEAELEAWRQLDDDAVRILREALAGHRGEGAPRAELQAAMAALREGCRRGGYPYDQLVGAVGPIEERSDEEAAIAAAGALVDPMGDPGLESEVEAATMSLEHADWLGAVVELVRSGTGAAVAPDAMVEYIDRCPEVEGEVDPDDHEVLAIGFSPVVDVWEAAGLVERGRLTRLGVWALPRGLAQGWGGDFDGVEA